MTIDRLVMAFAGSFILASLFLFLAWAHSIYWIGFTGFVGLNLLQVAFTGFCPLAIILKNIGRPPGMAFKEINFTIRRRDGSMTPIFLTPYESIF